MVSLPQIAEPAIARGHILDRAVITRAFKFEPQEGAHIASMDYRAKGNDRHKGPAERPAEVAGAKVTDEQSGRPNGNR